MQNRFPIIRVVSKLLIPYIVLFALYVQFHGDFGPGGGFQAGVILAAAVICYGLVFGLQAAKRFIPPVAVEFFIGVGVLIYAGTGFLTIFLGGNFLDYDVLEHHIGHAQDNLGHEGHHLLPSGQHLGLFLVELGVGVCVAAVMVAIFYAFAGRHTRFENEIDAVSVSDQPPVEGSATS